MKLFEGRMAGKWVLCGEHAVIRGQPALTLPHPEYFLEYRFSHEEGELEIQTEGGWKETLLPLVKAWPSFTGKWIVRSTIPPGAGFGSSAAICVMIAQIAHSLRLVDDDLLRLATRLENHFHGRSSGMDVASVMAAGPLLYSKEKQETIQTSKQGVPRFTFHDTGLRAKTKDCVQKVSDSMHGDPTLGVELDQMMGAATLRAKGGLVSGKIDWIQEAMDWAHQCFVEWGLVPDSVRLQRRDLLNQGALSVKLTGAGNGGFLVALWPN